MSGHRIAGRGRVDGARPLGFTFDGKAMSGLAGDTLASALIANGVSLVGRSFKYHRPRGLLGAGSEEPNALVGVDRGIGRHTPNVRATTIELHEALAVETQNRWPSLGFDLGTANSLMSGLFPAGFYNKTFMWPRGAWDKVYEPAIRRMAGLGKAPDAVDADRYTATYAHVDVVVVGAGRAGIQAALAAASEGGRVLLIDEQNEPGGKLLSLPARWTWLSDAIERLMAAGVTILPRTTAIGLWHDGFIGAVERLTDHLAPGAPDGPRERLHRVRAGKIVLAAGAIERPLVFADNDRPGVMLASAAATYLHRYGVAVGDRVALMALHDSGYQTAFDLADADVSVPVIVDARASVDPALIEGAAKRGIELLAGHSVTATAGGKRLTRITVVPVAGGAARNIACDTLLMAGGWTPTVHLWSHLKGKLEWNGELGAYVPFGEVPQVTCVGACAGAIDPGNALILPALPSPRDPATFKAFVDFQNDVTARDIRLAVREGFRSIEHVKRYTTNGMATDQGKTSNLNGMQVAAEMLEKSAPGMGLTTFRPPYTPTSFGALAGIAKDRLFQPVRKTAIDAWAEEEGAVFENVAQWRRARYFPRAGEDMHAAVARECRAVRTSVGIFDASTLGKIEVVGPDAAEFLNRLYTNPWKQLAPGRCRYGLLLREDGFITDDGVAARLADDRFHVTTTTGGAARVLNMMEDYLQTEWPDLNVWLTSTTEQYAVIAVQGPRARDVIAPLVEGVDLSPGALPHMAYAEGMICGVPLRLFRVSFTGELGFEVNVPAGYGRAVWEAIWAEGRRHDVVAYGTETMHVLRAEKGFIIVGQDTDGTLTPDDAGIGWAVGKKKPDFVGKRSLARVEMMRADRKQLVGLLTEDPKLVLEEGAQIVVDPGAALPMPMIGHVTSSYWSVALGRSIALAVVAGGRARMGETLYVPMPSATHKVTVTGTIFYDPKGTRLDG
jgi:sarcosine oxidase subunit alpha